MPKKFEPTEFDFAMFERELRKRGFVSVAEAKRAGELQPLKRRSKRPRPGIEEGFVFRANGLTVWVWTTWLRAEKAIRESDNGWVVISEGEVPLYFSHPLNRTKYFLLNLFRRAWIARHRVIKRPACFACGQFMKIVRGENLKERFWQCDNVSQHRNHRNRSVYWDIGLPPRARKYVNALRQKQKAYNEKCIAEGKSPHAAMLKRDIWKKGGSS